MGPLSSVQINALMSSEKGFLGCAAHNQLVGLGVPKTGGSVVMNLENSNQPGSHWVSFYFGPGTAEYFDSFGLPPDGRSFDYLNKSGKKVMWNNEKLQLNNSDECGYYAMDYIRGRNSGKSMSQVLNQFHGIPGSYNEAKAVKLAK
jgi:hypothetical protein